ncbi:MAG: YCF48-related protein, partial [Candidatus Marinimicrobia bacterium]|nr:YCF48-related protein [Candidatus Neomarinimicrobiota bacterium]
YFTDANNGFVGGDVYSSVIWKTTDGGNNWHEISLPLESYNSDISDIKFFNSSNGMIVCNNGQIAKTTDGGNNWTEVTSPTTEGLNEIYFVDTNNGYIVGDSKTVLKTTNGGSSWTVASTVSSSYDDYLNVYFTDVNTGYTTTDNGVYKTTDGGANWTSVFYQYDYYIHTLDKRDGFAYAFTAGGHLFKTSDNWENHSVINSQASEIINAVDFVDIHNGIAVDSDGNIMRTTDGGENWELIDSGCSSLYDVQYLDANDVIAVGNGGEVLKSTNNGATWSSISTADIPTNTLYGFDAPSANVFYVVGYNGTIVKSSDGGTNWTEQTSGYAENLYDVTFLNENTGFAVGGKYNESKILKTTNGGSNWNDVTCPVSRKLNKITFINSTTGFIVGYYGTILKTTNGGDDWTDISKSTSSEFKDISFANENVGVLVGTYAEIYYTEDGGINWNADETFPANNWLFGVDFVDDSTGYVVGMYSSILRYRKGEMPPVVTVQELPEIVDEYILKQNYPNPFNPVTTIAYEIPEAAKVTINIYNVTGQKVETLLSEYKQSGKYQIVWNANNFASGVYFYKIQTKDFVKTNKMLLLK